MPGPALAAEGAGCTEPDGCSRGAPGPPGAQMWGQMNAEKSRGTSDQNRDGIWRAWEPRWERGLFHLGESESLLEQALLFVGLIEVQFT